MKMKRNQGLQQTQADFAAATRTCFAFLRPLGFEETVAESLYPTRPLDSVLAEPLGGAHIRFERAGISLDIYNDPRAEIQVAVGPVSARDMRLDLDEIVIARDWRAVRAKPWATGGIFSSGETPVSTVLAAVAETIRDYCGPFLLGDMSAYESVLSRRSRNTAQK